MRKYLPYILIIITLVGIFSPILAVNAQTNPATASWYFEYKTTGGQNVIMGPYATQKICQDNGHFSGTLVRGCFLSNMPPTVTPETAKWYFEYKTTGGQNVIMGPYATQKICQDNGHFSGTAVRGCFLSDTTPTVTPATTLTPAPTPAGGAVPCTAPNTPAGCVSTNYQFLAPLPDPNKNNELSKEFNPKDGLGSYLNLMIKIFIGLCAVLSVVMIVVGGLEYMTSELISSKEHGKERITHAILGLLLALGAYTLLFTINPDLLKSDVNITPTTVTLPTSHLPTGTCSDPQYTTATDCGSHEGSWTASTGTCSDPQFTTASDCGSNEGSWTANP